MKSITLLRACVCVFAGVLSTAGAVADDKTQAAAVEESAEGEPVVKAELKDAVQVEGKKEKPPSGWREVRRGGVLYWCRKAPPTGSRVRSELECATPTQFKERSRTDRSNAEELIRNAPGPKGG